MICLERLRTPISKEKYLSTDYDKFTAVILEGLKELDEKLNVVVKRVEKLESK